MGRAGAFTAIPGGGGVAMGATALATAWIAGTPSDSFRWLAWWLSDACLATAIAAVAVVLKSRQSATPLLAAPTRRFALAYLPPIAAAAALTTTFAANGPIARLPGLWLVAYGL